MSVARFESRKKAIRPIANQRSSGWPTSTIPHASPERKRRSSPSSAWWTTHTTYLNPCARRYESLKRLSDSKVIALALFKQLRGIESERSFLRDIERFFSHLFPGMVGFHPSSFHRRMRKLRRFLEPLRQDVVSKLVGDPETLIVDSTLLSVLPPRQVKQSGGFEGAAWVRWGSFSVYGVKLHLLSARPIG
jgi:hypothetical protein